MPPVIPNICEGDSLRVFSAPREDQRDLTHARAADFNAMRAPRAYRCLCVYVGGKIERG